MDHNYIFDYKRIHLRPLRREDIEPLRILRNQLNEFFLNQMQISAEQQEQWYQNYLNRKNDIMFAVELANRPKEFIGAIAIYNIDLSTGIAECGRTVIDKGRAVEKGIGIETTVASCLFAFEVLDIQKIVAEILKSNERILKVDTRAGFQIVGGNDEVWFIEMTRNTIQR